MIKDILEGLRQKQKYIPSKYFYDSVGSELFEQICDLPEYYQTRTELKLLSEHATQIVRGFGHGNLVELGSGSNRKIRILLDAIEPSSLSALYYMPVDICSAAIAKSSAELRQLFPLLNVEPLVADFTRSLNVVKGNSPKLILFFGSTIGNFNQDETSSFIKNVANSMNPCDRLLVGLDMVKPVHILEAAYNDSLGLTARFNKNILRAINRETGANFQLDIFEHCSYFNEQHEQIEMHLRATKDTLVLLSGIGASIMIRSGETIRTEICRKFRRSGAEDMFDQAGMRIDRWYTDPKGWFSIVEVVLRQKAVVYPLESIIE
jgi:L-histidine N-alpha-methyltransferase